MDAQVAPGYSLHRHPRTGRPTLLSPDGEPMHSCVGPLEEALGIHVGGSRLPELRHPDGSPIVVWDVGLGAAANAVAALQSRPSGLALWSFENDVRGARAAIAASDALGYLPPWSEALQTLVDEGRWSQADGSQSWRLLTGDFFERMAEAPDPDVVFYDFYDPPSCPALWSTEAFSRLAGRLRPSGKPVRLTTYSASTKVRAALVLAGFHVGEGPSTTVKSRSTIVSLHPDAIERPLGEAWLGRVARSSEPFPFDWPSDFREGDGLLDLLDRLTRGVFRQLPHENT